MEITAKDWKLLRACARRLSPSDGAPDTRYIWEAVGRFIGRGWSAASPGERLSGGQFGLAGGDSEFAWAVAARLAVGGELGEMSPGDYHSLIAGVRWAFERHDRRVSREERKALAAQRRAERAKATEGGAQ